MSKTFFKRSLKQKKSTENMGDEVKQGNFLFHIDTKRETKTSSKHISIFLIFFRSNLYISFCICLCFFRYYLLCMLELIHFFTLVPSTFLLSKRSKFRWDTLIILFHRKIKLAFKPFSGEMG